VTAFLALLHDAYRELNSKRLFWVILGLSVLVVTYFASIGFDENGMTMFFGLVDIESAILTRDSPMAVMLYRSIFASFIVGLWLAWVATILALISTTTIFPDFVAGGAIDLVLAKPVGRIRLFFFKYLTSLLFVLLQVSIFCVGIFFCLGLRLDDWEWKIFLAIPVVMLFYSYLFSINVLVGVWTRSGLTALLVTMLFWVSLFGINMSETILNQFKTDMTVQVENLDASNERVEASIAATRQRGGDDEAAIARLEGQVASTTAERDKLQEIVDKLERWHRPIRGAKVVLPKTTETIALLDRWLRRDTDINLMDLLAGNVAPDGSGGFTTTDGSRDREVQRRMEEEFNATSAWTITGSSLLFEGVILSLACVIFIRRDF
jgi:ABC-type transport system involved in multi-copper enzyme maturation permease subunit